MNYEAALHYLVRCYSFNIFDFYNPHETMMTPVLETLAHTERHRDALAIKFCIIENSMKNETWFSL